MKTYKTATILLILALGPTANAAAASLSQQFRNDFDTNRIWLWAMEPTTEFTNFTLDNAPVSSWLVPIDTGSELMFESNDGSTVAPSAGRFTVDFDYTTPTFSFEWAEIFWDGATNTLLGSGTAIWNGSSWSGNGNFTHLSDLAPSPVPVPASFGLLASGALFGIGFARRNGTPRQRP